MQQSKAAQIWGLCVFLDTLRRIRLVAFAFVTVVLAAAPSAAAQSDITLAWNPSAGATGYVLLFGTTRGQYTSSMDVGNQTTATFHPTVVNQVYYFAVKAYNAAGAQSTASNDIGAWVGVTWRTPSLLQMGDFDGDGRADSMVYRGSTGEWFVKKSTGGLSSAAWGSPSLGDVPVPADYDGDGRTDYAVYREATGQWFLNRSRDGGSTSAFGAPLLRDVPVPADYDGDGRTDIAVFRRTTGQWFILQSSTGLVRLVTWGAAGDGDMPVPADYNGNGLADIAVYRRSTGQWFVLFDNMTSVTWNWGAAAFADVPVPADYDGDGTMDIGVFRLSTGTWIVHLSATNGTRTLTFGAPSLGDVPIPADYDGDGKADIAVFRASTATWHIAYAAGGSTSYAWGASTLGDTMAGVREFVMVQVL